MRKPLLLVVVVLAMLAAACGGGEAVVEPVAEPALAAEPTVAPTTEPTTAVPTPEPTAEPTAVPTVAPTPEPTARSTTEPTATPEPAPVAAPSPLCTRIAGFDEPNPTIGWFIVNDGVMGGRSVAEAAIADSVMRFTGTLVTAGGGFSSIRLALPLGGLGEVTELRLRARTDGRQYEVVAEDALPGRDRRVSHYGLIAPASAGEWSEITVDIESMEPRFFGRPVADLPLEPTAATTLGLFLADGLDGEFALEIDWIDACREPERV